jgi:hypothetical protein
VLCAYAIATDTWRWLAFSGFYYVSQFFIHFSINIGQVYRELIKSIEIILTIVTTDKNNET